MTGSNNHITQRTRKLSGASARMATILCIALLLFCVGPVRAQVISNNGAVMSVSSGAVVSHASDVNNTSGTISNDGSITATGNYINGATTSGNGIYNIGGNWTNNGTFTAGTGSVILNGAVPQTIGGSITSAFYNLFVNNASGVALGGIDAYVGSTLNFSAGTISTGAKRLVVGFVGTGGTVTGAGAGKYVNGNLRKYIPNGAPLTVGFEIGDAANYTPVSVDFVGGVIAGSGYLDVSTAAAIPPVASGLIPAKSVNRSWTVTNGGVAGFTTYNPTFNFVPGDVAGGANTANFKVSQNVGGIWSFTPVGTRTATSTQATGLTNFGIFALGEGNVTITATAIAGVTPPATGSVPVTTVIPGIGYTGTVTWSGSPAAFTQNTVYTATITIVPDPGYTLTGVTANQFTIAGSTSATNNVSSGVITAVFPVTDTSISSTFITGVTPPVTGVSPVTSITPGSGFTGTVSWSGSPLTFDGSTVYIATITIIPNAGYTVAGILANQFTVPGATSVTNSSDSGVITAMFPATAPVPQGSITANGPFCGTGAGLLTWIATTGTAPYTVVYNDGTANRTVNAVLSGKPFAPFINPVAHTTTYTLVSVTDAIGTRISGFSGASAAIAVNALPIPVLTSSDADNVICAGDAVTFTAAGAGTGTYEFFVNGISQGTAGTKTTFTTANLTNGNTVTVKVTNAGGCSAMSSGIATTVKALPTMLSTIPGSRCEAGTVTLGATTSAGTISWYATSTGGTAIGTGASFNTPVISTSVTYYVDATSNGCTTSTRTAVMATVNPSPTAPLVGTITGTTCDKSDGSVVLNNLPATGTWMLTRIPDGKTTAGTGTSTTLTGLPAGSFTFSVAAATGCKSPESGVVAIAATSSLPAAPAVGAATNITQTTLSANWSSLPNALGYSLDVATDAGFNNYLPGFANKDLGNVTTYTVTGLSAKTNYFYRIRAYNLCGSGNNSATATASTLENIPAVPVANPATTMDQSSFRANWSTIANATGYKLDVATDAGFTTFVNGYADKDAGNVAFLRVTGLKASTNYYFRVRAYNTGGASSNSNTVATRTLDDQLTPSAPPAAPIANSATKLLQTGFIANWNASATATGYRLDVATDPAFTSFVSGFANKDVVNVTTFSITALTAKTTYYYRLRAYNDGGTSENSNIVSVITLSIQPSAPTGLTANSCNNQVTLKWNQIPADADFLRYRIYVGPTNNPTSILDSTSNSISEISKTISGLTNGQTYYFRITSVHRDGVESTFSNQATSAIKTGDIPVITMKWNDVLICNNVGDLFSNYQWYNGGLAIPGATGQYYVSNKQAGSYIVGTTDSHGCLNFSNEIKIVTTKSLTVYPNPASASFTLKLTDVVQGNAVISIFNMAGQKVIELKADNINEQLIREIAVNNLTDGSYVVQVMISQDEIYQTKLIVKK